MPDNQETQLPAPAESTGGTLPVEQKRVVRAIPVGQPPFRRLQGFAFDPSLSTELENAVINQTTMKVLWESHLKPGPVGEYLEVIDVDPRSDCCYAPVDLNQDYLLASDGLEPSEGNPQFHQQMVYAVAMTTIRNFERALGRTAFWAPYDPKRSGNGKERPQGEYVQRLRIYPHALREANAYYSPTKKALLFGYFPAPTSAARFFPGGMVFTCLSHDIVAHETTHALLDGMHNRFDEPSNPDALAFHEAFADLVALFQHFSVPQVMEHQIAKTRGDLATENLLMQLAQQFGQATEAHGALRDALGEYDENNNWRPKPIEPQALVRELEPHARGSLLVAAVFDAFLAIYKSRVADLLRIATGGTGVLPAGSLHPDLVKRMAKEATKSAEHVLTMCIRALDYMAPVDVTFGEYLRALITADYDLVQDDDHGYRIAFVEAFRRRGIYPHDVRNLSIESLLWSEPTSPNFQPYLLPVVQELANKVPEWNVTARSKEIFDGLAAARAALDGMLKKLARSEASEKLKELFELDPVAPFEVHSLRPVRRVGPDGEILNDLVIEITQRRPGSFDADIQKQLDDQWKKTGKLPQCDFIFRGGCTVLVDMDSSQVRYCIYKHLGSDSRLARQRTFQSGEAFASFSATAMGRRMRVEPFALLHHTAGLTQEEMEWLL